jgi:hypothetical protein
MMFPQRLSELTESQIQDVIKTEIAEGIDFELKRALSGEAGKDFPLVGRQGILRCNDLHVQRTWHPRLRAVEREFSGGNLFAVDRIGTEGQIDRFVRVTYTANLPRPQRYDLGASELTWNLASVVRLADIVRSQCSRPTQLFALEIELMPSDTIHLYGYPGHAQSGGGAIPNERVLFPRYEIGPRESFNELMTIFDTDLWHLAGINPDYNLAVTWPAA